MGYFHLKKGIKGKIPLTVGQLDVGLIEELIKENINNSDDEKEPISYYFKSSELNEVSEIIYTLLNKDSEETKRDNNPEDFSSNYFLWIKNPVVQMMSFSCKLKNLDGGSLIYDVVRLIKIQGDYYLILPEDD